MRPRWRGRDGGNTLGAAVGGPRGTAGVRAQWVLRGNPAGVARGLRAPAGGWEALCSGGGGGRLRRMAWPARRLLGVFPANSWLTPQQLGRERIPQPRQPPGAGAAGRDHGSAWPGTAWHSTSVTRQASTRHGAVRAQVCTTSTMPCPHCHSAPEGMAKHSRAGGHILNPLSQGWAGRRPGGSLPHGWSQGHTIAQEGAVPTAQGTGPSTFSHAHKKPRNTHEHPSSAPSVSR